MSIDQGRGIVSAAFIFAQQSFFDNALLELAVLDQGVGNFIAKNTVQQVDVAGYGVALHPTSETPVAVEFQRAGQQGSTATVILKPGQILFPFGRSKEDRFQGLKWGLPYGWLGGGLAHLVIITSPEVVLDWPKANDEVIFHRQRVPVYPLATDFAAISALYADGSGPRNWPTRFPARTTRRLGTAIARIDQSGQPSIRVQPTRTALQLRLSAVAASGITRFVFLAPEALINAAPAAVPTESSVFDVTWGVTALVGAGLTLPAQFMVQEFTGGPLVTLGIEQPAMTGVVVFSDGASAALNAGAGNVFIDIVRYGKI